MLSIGIVCSRWSEPKFNEICTFTVRIGVLLVYIQAADDTYVRVQTLKFRTRCQLRLACT